MKAQTLAILGLNRMGVSIALAIKQSPLDVSLIGYDADREVARLVKDDLKAVDRLEWNLVAAVQKADIIVLTLPAGELEQGLQAMGRHLREHALVLDMSGLKQAGREWAAAYLQAGHYVGVHPLLGAEWLADGRDDVRFASAELFKKSAFCLMPSAATDPQAVETAVNVGILLGSLPFFLDVVEFDRLTQGTDLLPGLVALAMYRTLADAPGWRDMLRLAGMPFTLATATLQDSEEIVRRAQANPQTTVRWLDLLIAQLEEIRTYVQKDDSELLQAIAAETTLEREKWLRRRKKNEWDERTMPPIEQRSFNEHLLGGLAAGKRDEKED